MVHAQRCCVAIDFKVHLYQSHASEFLTNDIQLLLPLSYVHQRTSGWPYLHTLSASRARLQVGASKSKPKLCWCRADETINLNVLGTCGFFTHTYQPAFP